jgi:hypothetical protein
VETIAATITSDKSFVPNINLSFVARFQHLYVAIAFRSLLTSLLAAWRKATTIINKKTCRLHRTRPASGPSQSRHQFSPAPLDVRKSRRTTRRLDSHHPSHGLELLVLLAGHLAPVAVARRRPGSATSSPTQMPRHADTAAPARHSRHTPTSRPSHTTNTSPAAQSPRSASMRVLHQRIERNHQPSNSRHNGAHAGTALPSSSNNKKTCNDDLQQIFFQPLPDIIAKHSASHTVPSAFPSFLAFRSLFVAITRPASP